MFRSSLMVGTAFCVVDKSRQSALKYTEIPVKTVLENTYFQDVS